LSPERWRRLLADLSIAEDTDTWAALKAAYSERHRHYHTARHITHCLAELDLARFLAAEPAEVEMALWFHDAVYRPRASDNELQSAAWAERFLGSHAVDPERILRVREHIMATRHTAPADSADSQLVVDVDLAILGSDAQTYAQFESNVRKEYRWVPGPLFRTRRAQILQSFFDRHHIYHTTYFRDRCEAAARANLETAIRALRS
jgi:predicted metal-dependent HD superfamily phosphohydrolase